MTTDLRCCAPDEHDIIDQAFWLWNMARRLGGDREDLDPHTFQARLADFQPPPGSWSPYRETLRKRLLAMDTAYFGRVCHALQTMTARTVIAMKGDGN